MFSMFDRLLRKYMAGTRLFVSHVSRCRHDVAAIGSFFDHNRRRKTWFINKQCYNEFQSSQNFSSMPLRSMRIAFFHQLTEPRHVARRFLTGDTHIAQRREQSEEWRVQVGEKMERLLHQDFLLFLLCLVYCEPKLWSYMEFFFWCLVCFGKIPSHRGMSARTTHIRQEKLDLWTL